MMWRVVGVTKSDESSNSNTFYAPFTTVRTVYGKGKAIDEIIFSFHGLNSQAESDAFEKEYRAAINKRHRAAPDDERAIGIWNSFAEHLQMNKGERILSTALWVIGLFTLLGGIVGVSNIMLITVKERTHEFGIRKAIGASPWNITKLIIAESIGITAFFGYIGMVLGMIACYIMDQTIGQESMDMFGQSIRLLINPTVGLNEAIKSTVLLVISGTVAGLFPAVKAARVRPIEALRAD